MRSKKAFKNTMWGLIYEAAVLICGFVLPRLIINSYGSEYNGITNTVKQFLQVITLFQAGIGAVTMSSLYKPLSEKDKGLISVIIKTTERYLRKVALIFVGISMIFACLLPVFIKEFNFIFVAGLVMIMSLSTFAQYFFGQTYQFLLYADQRQKIMHIINTVKVITNTILSVVLINLGFGIHLVTLGSAIVFIIAPVFLYIYVNKNYQIDRNAKANNNTLKQRWDNFGIQVSNFITTNTALVVLSIFSNMKVASVYVVYNMVVNGIFGLFTPFTNGVTAALGNMLAKDERALLEKNTRLYEQLVFVLSTFLFGVAAATILPFVSIYTSAAKDDVYYLQPAFAYIIIVATLFRAYRYPYAGLVAAAGHFKQNRNLSFVEAGINIVVSLTLAIALSGYYKLLSVVIGTLLAYAFRTIRYAMYISDVLVPRSYFIFIKRIVLSLLIVTIIAFLPYVIPTIYIDGLLGWIINTTILSVIALALVVVVEFVFYRNDLKDLIEMGKRALRKGDKLIKKDD